MQLISTTKVNQFPWLDDEQVKRLKKVLKCELLDIYRNKERQELYESIEAKKQKIFTKESINDIYSKSMKKTL